MGRGIFLIEPVVGVYALAMFMTPLLVQQYVYRRKWEEITGHAFPKELNVSHCDITQGSNHSNLHGLHGAVQRATSLFLLHSELCFLLPSLLSSLLLLSCSDSHGRKVALFPPLLGDTSFMLVYALVSHFSLELRYVLPAAFLRGLLGGPAPLLGACFAYVADRCGEEVEPGSGSGWGSGRKTTRMALLEMLLGLQSGVAALCSGFYIQRAGFTWPFLTVATLHVLALLYVLFALKETVGLSKPAPSPGAAPQARLPPEPTPGQPLSPPPPPPPAPDPVTPPGPDLWCCRTLLMKAASSLRAVVSVFSSGTTQGCHRAALVLTLASFALYNVVVLGGMSLFVLYELNAPLCWDEVAVGYGSALSSAAYPASFAGVWLLSRRLALADLQVATLGFVSLAAGFVMAAFARTTLLMYLVRIPMLFSIMPSPIMRSMMSKMVLSSEQGAMFACVAFLEMVSAGLAFPMFSSTYAATVAWFPGFSFLLAAAITLLPITFICAIQRLQRDILEDTSQLIPPESPSLPDQEMRL
ncbi:lysosomal proton-coupled steroid conjugate and bile acid symporter SLC46A3 [Engraulis encrasicolus]|uniref:lysosomal proton-coupled steroid conjugate and bile acid symporter SLC46A3 n=1 Tax=Engraulis encrasicolus TaxID=184585 RepID=UPI002FD2C12C